MTSKRSLPEERWRKHEHLLRVDAKTLQENLQSLDCTPSSAKPEIGKEVARRRARS